MKNFKIFSALTGLALAASLAGCEGEKELIIIEGNLPIKTSTLYMVGDATPNGWSIDNPTPLTASEADGLVFTWEGTLYGGEIKLCLVPGSWDNAFIRPKEHGREIGREAIVDETFQMHAGDPDEKWRVTEAGVYLLSFNMRDWTYSTTFIRALDGPSIEPIQTEAMYIVGDATPVGWNIDEPFALTKTADYTFVYEGKLKTGELKGYTVTGNWGAPTIRPTSANVKINSNGIESDDFVYGNGPDDKWVVEEVGMYRLTFDLANWKVKSEYLGEAPAEDPLLSATKVYMIGDATPGGWGWDGCIEMEQTSTPHEFVWSGELATGWIKASVEKDYGAPFIRPSHDGVKINENGVEEPGFIFVNDPDDKWQVTKAGYYTITLNLENCTIAVRYDGEQELDPLMAATEVYMIGDATPNGWGWDNCIAIKDNGSHIFSWTGMLSVGTVKASIKKDYGAPFIRPSHDGVVIDQNGVAEPGFIFVADPDDKWKVETAGCYTFTFNLEARTIEAKYEGTEEPDPSAKPLESATLFMIGSATPNGWSMDNASEFTRDEANRYIFTWTGQLTEGGTFKACLERDGSFSCPFLRPAKANVEVSAAGVAEPGFIYTKDPDDQWLVTKSGKYRLTFDLEHWTLSATYLD